MEVKNPIRKQLKSVNAFLIFFWCFALLFTTVLISLTVQTKVENISEVKGLVSEIKENQIKINAKYYILSDESLIDLFITLEEVSLYVIDNEIYGIIIENVTYLDYTKQIEAKHKNNLLASLCLGIVFTLISVGLIIVFRKMKKMPLTIKKSIQEMVVEHTGFEQFYLYVSKESDLYKRRKSQQMVIILYIYIVLTILLIVGVIIKNTIIILTCLSFIFGITIVYAIFYRLKKHKFYLDYLDCYEKYLKSEEYVFNPVKKLDEKQIELLENNYINTTYEITFNIKDGLLIFGDEYIDINSLTYKGKENHLLDVCNYGVYFNFSSNWNCFVLAYLVFEIKFENEETSYFGTVITNKLYQELLKPVYKLNLEKIFDYLRESRVKTNSYNPVKVLKYQD